jgi:hypothetical protein
MASSGGGAPAHHDLAWAHQQLLHDHTLQLSFARATPPKPPHWLEALLRWITHALHWAAPALKVIFWGGLAVMALVILYAVVRELTGQKRDARIRPASFAEGGWRPTAEQARVLLEDADRMAAEGRFAEAAHLLLFRSIDDIRRARPDLVRPALTSRDIAALEALPEAARPAFARIAEIVERSFFGGRPVAASEFDACRRDYEAFALAGAWR